MISDCFSLFAFFLGVNLDMDGIKGKPVTEVFREQTYTPEIDCASWIDLMIEDDIPDWMSSKGSSPGVFMILSLPGD